MLTGFEGSAVSDVTGMLKYCSSSAHACTVDQSTARGVAAASGARNTAVRMALWHTSAAANRVQHAVQVYGTQTLCFQAVHPILPRWHICAIFMQCLALHVLTSVIAVCVMGSLPTTDMPHLVLVHVCLWHVLEDTRRLRVWHRLPQHEAVKLKALAAVRVKEPPLAGLPSPLLQCSGPEVKIHRLTRPVVALYVAQLLCCIMLCLVCEQQVGAVHYVCPTAAERVRVAQTMRQRLNPGHLLLRLLPRTLVGCHKAGKDGRVHPVLSSQDLRQ